MIVLNRAFPLFFWQFSEFFGTFFAARSFSVLLKIVHATVKRMTFTWNNRKFHFFSLSSPKRNCFQMKSAEKYYIFSQSSRARKYPHCFRLRAFCSKKKLTKKKKTKSAAIPAVALVFGVGAVLCMCRLTRRHIFDSLPKPSNLWFIEFYDVRAERIRVLLVTPKLGSNPRKGLPCLLLNHQ